jgi:DNA-binding CsgD family transcriptional regulator
MDNLGWLALYTFVMLLIGRPVGDALRRWLRETAASVREVLALMAEGRSNSAIAQRLFITEKAVGKHSTSIFGKLGLVPSEDDNRRVLAVLAYLNA